MLKIAEKIGKIQERVKDIPLIKEQLNNVENKVIELDTHFKNHLTYHNQIKANRNRIIRSKQWLVKIAILIIGIIATLMGIYVKSKLGG